MGEAARKQEAPVLYMIQAGNLTDRQIDNRMKRLAEIDEEIKALETERDALKAEITASMQETRSTMRWTISNKQVSSMRFDSRSFKADHPKLYADYCKPATTTRFTYRAI